MTVMSSEGLEGEMGKMENESQRVVRSEGVVREGVDGDEEQRWAR